MSTSAKRSLTAALAPVVVLLATIAAPAAVAGSAAYAPSSLSRAGTGVTAEDPATPGKLLLMLDASGSMLDPDPSGLTKIEAAKKALTGVIDALPSTANVGLRVYGATVQGGTPTPEACADTQLVHPIGALDKAGLTAAIAAFAAKGETPIAHSLEKAIEDLGPTGKRNIVLVSDGEESCVPDPCPVVQQLIGSGIDLQIDTVGFAVGDKARQQLQCIAEAGHGTYYDAANADQIAASLRKLSTRAVREFAINGTPIDGTPSASGAPTLKAGLWVDTLTTGAKKHYVLERTIPHSTMRVAVSARPPIVGEESSTEVIRFDGVPTVDGQVTDKYGGCGSLPGMSSRIGLTSLRYVTTDRLEMPGGTNEKPEKCGADSLPFWISRDEGSSTPVRVEILVIEEPPLASPEPSASPLPAVTGSPVAPQNPQPVTGGSSFSDAPLIDPGSWTEQFVPGETIFYRVHLDWGQSLRLTVASPENERLSPLYDGVIYTPDRKQTKAGTLGNTRANGTPPLAREIVQVRYDNRDGGFENQPVSIAGDYFISINMPTTIQPGDAGVLFPVTFRVDVEGTPRAAPTYLKPTAPSASASASGADTTPTAGKPPVVAEGPGSVLPWVGGGLVGLAALAGIGYAVWRRRAATAPPAPAGASPTHPDGPIERH